MPDPTYHHLTVHGPKLVRDRLFAELEGREDDDLFRAHVPATDHQGRERWGGDIVRDIHRRHGDEVTELWFDTWRGLPDLWLEALGGLFPSLDFNLSFDSPGNCYQGHVLIRQGEVIEKVMGIFDYESGRDDSEDFPSLEEAGALRGPEELPVLSLEEAAGEHTTVDTSAARQSIS